MYEKNHGTNLPRARSKLARRRVHRQKLGRTLKLELEKYIPMVIPGFMYTFYVIGYNGDFVRFLLTTIYYSTILVISANLIVSIVQIVSIKSSILLAKLLYMRIEKWLKKLSFNKQQIADTTKDLKKVMGEISNVTSEKSKEVLRNLTNLDSLFAKSPTLYYLLFVVLVSVAFDFIVYSGGRNNPNSIIFGIIIFCIISILSVRQIIALVFKIEKALDQFRKNNPLK